MSPVGERHVTMTELAQRLELTLPAVSNWRRRHESFPSPVEADGRELFPVDEVATWLDGRKISKKDLKPDELPGATYGARFRKAMGLGHTPDDAVNDGLWRTLGRFRGAEDIADFADLVLGLLYLAASNKRQWDDIVMAEGVRRRRLVELACRGHEPPLLDLLRARRALDNDRRGETRLAGILHLVGRIRQAGRVVEVFEFLLDRFAAEEGRRDAVVHTPSAVVRLLVESVAPEPGTRVLDPCCGFGGFLVGVAKYLATRGGPDASFTGHAVSQRSASLASMNLRLHGVAAEVDASAGLVFRDEVVLTPAKHFDVVLTNPPFDLKAPLFWPRTLQRRHGWLPTSRSDFLWLQYVASSIEAGGRAAVVMPGSALFREGVEQQIRANLVDGGIVEAIIALPPQMFVSTAVPVSVWLLSRSERRRADEILLVDASALGHMISRAQRSLSDEDRSRIVDAVTTWRAEGYEDVRGFSASVSVPDIRAQDYVLTPARYVGSTITVDALSVSDLRDELARLEHRAGEVNAVVERQLDRIQAWIR